MTQIYANLQMLIFKYPPYSHGELQTLFYRQSLMFWNLNDFPNWQTPYSGGNQNLLHPWQALVNIQENLKIYRYQIAVYLLYVFTYVYNYVYICNYKHIESPKFDNGRMSLEQVSDQRRNDIYRLRLFNSSKPADVVVKQRFDFA